MKKFVRPVLCRLCECPAGSDGVRMSDVDIEKLSRWWGKALETEFEDEELEKKFFCQFCLWDAKYQGKEEFKGEDCDWWTGHDASKFYRQFHFKRALMQPCAVRISPLALTSGCKKKLVKCIYCAESFRSKKSAYNHVLKRHDGLKPIACTKCFLHFLTYREIKAHRLKVHPSKIFCHLCGTTVRTHLLSEHISEQHDQDHFECCGGGFLGREALAKHFKKEPKASCMYCLKMFAGHKFVLKHIRRMHTDVAIQCNYTNCRKYFRSAGDKDRHVVEIHEGKAGMVQCIYCSFKVVRNKLPIHVRKHHQSRAIRCDFNKACLSYFVSESDRDEHVRTTHFKTKLAKTTKCKECGKICEGTVHLRKHLRGAHELTVNICRFLGCSDYFRTVSGLEMHFRKKHAAEEEKKKFQCGECSYRARVKGNLRIHIIGKHIPDGSHKCKMCSESYKTPKHLWCHIRRTHSEQVKKNCPHCHCAVDPLSTHLTLLPCWKCKFVAPCRNLKKEHMRKCKVKLRKMSSV